MLPTRGCTAAVQLSDQLVDVAANIILKHVQVNLGTLGFLRRARGGEKKEGGGVRAAALR